MIPQMGLTLLTHDSSQAIDSVWEIPLSFSYHTPSHSKLGVLF